MEKVYERCAGIDIQKRQITVCVMSGETKTSRTFGIGESDVEDLARWLRDYDCEAAVMENRNPLWERLYRTLDEALELTVILVIDWEEMKQHQVPARKAGLTDGEWLAYLLSYGRIQSISIPGAAARGDCKQLRRTKKEFEESLIRQTECVVDIVERERRRLGIDMRALPVHEDLWREVKELLRSPAVSPMTKETLKFGRKNVTDLQTSIARLADLIEAYERKK